MESNQVPDNVFNMSMDTTDVSGPYTEVAEASLEIEVAKPTSTEELRGLLKEAGTELTVKYLTGRISFEEFSAELQMSKRQSLTQPGPSSASQDTQGELTDLSTIPNFDLIMEQDYVGDEEESENEDEAEQEEEESWRAMGEEYLDDGEVSDTRDEDWVPPKQKKKQEGREARGKLSKKKEEEKETDAPKEKGRKKRKPRRKQFDIPKILAGTYGKAMLMRAQGKTEAAIMLFYDILKQAPRAAAPYEALGSIQEEMGNIRQAIKFYMLAANLRGKCTKNEWLELIDMCWKLNDHKLVMTCFVKGLNAATTSEAKLDLLSKRAAYYTEMDNRAKVLQTRELMLPYIYRMNPSSTLAFARDLITDYLEFKDENGAISILQFMTKEYPNDIDSQDIHNLVELYMDQKNYTKGIETIIKHCGVSLRFSSGIPEPADIVTTLQKLIDKLVTLESLEFPALMPIDLRSKLLQCIVRLKVLPNLDILKELIDSIVKMDADDYGDVHYDVAETMVMSDYHEAAKPILTALVKSEKYNEAAVWLTLGQCLNALGDLPASIEAYTRVVDMAPGHHEARVTLALLLQQMGQNEDALQILSKDNDGGTDHGDVQLLVHKCQLLHSQGRTEEFISASLRLLSLNVPRQISSDMVKSYMSMKTAKSRRQSSFFYKPVDKPGVPGTSAEANHFTFENLLGKGISQADKIKYLNNFWNIFMKLCRALRDADMNNKLIMTAALGVTCPIFATDITATKNVEFLCMKAGPVNEEVYHIARNNAIEDNRPQAWNLYNYILTRVKGNNVDPRYTTRCLMKNPESLPLTILNGNERMNAGTYTQAMAEYIAVFKKEPDNDLALFCAALCLLHIASNIHVNRKNILITQITCLLHAYRDLRGECQETYYNIGRAWNQINVQFAAVHYYKKALTFPPVIDDGKGTFDLCHEIGYNLSRIYLRSQNPDYARYYINKYCVI